jgi:polygalacturonase
MMDSKGFTQCGITVVTAMLALAAVDCGAGLPGEPGAEEPGGPGVVVADDPDLGQPSDGAHGDSAPGMYTPYADTPIEPISNAPFPMPVLERPSFPQRRFNIVDFGAVGDGVRKNTAAFLRAVAAAKKAHGGQIFVPAGKWLTGPIQITNDGGSCDGIDLHVDAGAEILFSTEFQDYLPPVPTRWEGMDVMNYSPLVYFRGCKNVALTGEGTLTGQGWVWWLWKNNLPVGATRDYTKAFATAVYKKYVRSDAGNVPVEARVVAARDASTLPPELQPSAVPVPANMPAGMTGLLRPSFVEFHTCDHVLIEGVTVQYGPFWMLHPVYSENVIVRNVHIVSWPDSGTISFTDADGIAHTVTPQNGDGCDPDSSRNVLIEDSFFNTSDDVVAIKSGLNEDGWRVNMPSENVVIRRIRSGNGHGGVTVGSEMSGSVRNVFAFDCDLTGDTALRIKTLPGRGGEIRNIHYDTMRIAAHNLALEVTTNYPSPTVTAPNFTLETRQRIPVMSDIFYDHISGTVIGTAALNKINKGAAIYIEGVPANVLQLPYNNVAGAPATAASPIRNVHMNDFVITTDNTWNWFDSAYMQRFPDSYAANATTAVSAAELAKLNTPAPGYQPSAPYGPASTYSFKSCLDVCPIQMTGVHVSATVAGGPSLAVDQGSFACVATDVAECH